VDSSSNLPSLIALSSAEGEYVQACIGAVSVAHIRMIVLEFKGLDPDSVLAIPMMIYNHAAQLMGEHFRDTKHM
jgi:hypothetical protein